MTDIKTAMHVRADDGDLVKITGDPTPREDMVRLNGQTADIRFRGEFLNWSAEIQIDYDPNVIGPDELLAIMSRAGKFVGVGEWRVEKSGIHGTWQVIKIEEVK